MKKRSYDDGRYLETHGMSRTKEYNIWANMIYRCSNESSHIWDNYGGRGIRVCNEWMSFDRFISDMGSRPSDNFSLDRIDVDGDYCKDNCRWASAKDQARNRRNSRMIKYKGRLISIHDFCDLTGMSKHAVISRFRRGWSDDRIALTPVRGRQC